MLFPIYFDSLLAHSLREILVVAFSLVGIATAGIMKRGLGRSRLPFGQKKT